MHIISLMSFYSKIALVAFFIAITCLGVAVTAKANDSAVILQYHRFGQSSHPSTNITIPQFENHIAHLKSEGYSVLPVPHIIAAIRAGQALPEKAIGITIDDAARSVYEIAWPRLKEAGFPFTLFVSTDPVDQNHRNVLNWDEIREMAESGVTIGNHSSAHDYMWRMNSDNQKADLDNAQKRFIDELGYSPRLFAYPFGEFDIQLQNEIKSRSFDSSFGQQSGVVHSQSDFYNLPRFSLNETYGDLERFKLIIDTLPLKITDLSPINPVLSVNPPIIGFTLLEQDNIDEKQLSCFASGQGQTSIELLGTNRVEIRLKKPLPKGRSRVNCTIPAMDKRYKWLGLQFILP